MEDISLDELKKEYAKLVDVTPVAELKEILPGFKYKYFKEILEYLKSHLEEEIIDWQKSLNNLDKESQDAIDAKGIIKELENKISLIQTILDESVKIDNAPVVSLDEFEKVTHHLIFAKLLSRNIAVLKDLKDIANEYYKTINDLFDALITRELQECDFKYIGSNNDVLNGIYEVRKDEIRIIFRIIDKNTLYIEKIKVKKNDNDKNEHNVIISRDRNVSDDFKNVSIDFKDPTKKSEIIKKNDAILVEICDILDGKINEKKGEGVKIG